MACRCAIAKALLNFYEVLRDRVRQSREVKQVPWSSAEPEVTIMHQSHKGQEKESDLIRPGRGVYPKTVFGRFCIFLHFRNRDVWCYAILGMAESRFYVGNEQITANVFLSGLGSFSS